MKKIFSFFTQRGKKNVNPSGYGTKSSNLVAWLVSEIGQVRKKLGANIRAFREKADLTQEQLAEKADLHPVYISLVENGYKAVSVEALWKISKALRATISSLFRGI